VYELRNGDCERLLSGGVAGHAPASVIFVEFRFADPIIGRSVAYMVLRMNRLSTRGSVALHTDTGPPTYTDSAHCTYWRLTYKTGFWIDANVSVSYCTPVAGALLCPFAELETELLRCWQSTERKASEKNVRDQELRDQGSRSANWPLLCGECNCVIVFCAVSMIKPETRITLLRIVVTQKVRHYHIIKKSY